MSSAAPSTGYSATPLDRKLGLKAALRPLLAPAGALWSGLKLVIRKEARP